MSDIDLSAEILNALHEYNTELALAVNEQAKKTASKLVRELKDISPRRPHNGKHYADGWRQRQTKKDKTESEFTVFNANKPGLTHLLEFGHAINGGTERVKAYPHIAQAEEKAANRFIDQVEKAIEGVGK